MRFTKNFTLQEMIYSSTALRRNIDNTPTKEGVIKLRLLAASLLQPIRDSIGSIRITSGYRSPQLSEAIGSSSNSQHCRYEAVDCQYVKRGIMDNLKIYKTLIEKDLDFDQCILEFGNPAPTELLDTDYPAWIHLSWKITDNRRQVLVAYKDENNKTKYRSPIEYKSI